MIPLANVAASTEAMDLPGQDLPWLTPGEHRGFLPQ